MRAPTLYGSATSERHPADGVQSRPAGLEPVLGTHSRNGCLGLFVAVFAGWLGLLSPASSAIEGITVIGFIGFFVFMIAMGIALLRSVRRAHS